MLRLCGRQISSTLFASVYICKLKHSSHKCCIPALMPTYTCYRGNSSSTISSNKIDEVNNSHSSYDISNKGIINHEKINSSHDLTNDNIANEEKKEVSISEKSETDTTSISTNGLHKSPQQRSSSSSTSAKVIRHKSQGFINSVTLVGVVHDIQTGYVFEDAVTQFTLTTTSLDTNNSTEECVVEKDHHTIRCFGDIFSQEINDKLTEGNVVCVNGRLRLNPQLEPSCNKYYYFPYIQVQPPHGQVSVIYSDCRTSPLVTSGKVDEINSNVTDNNSSSNTGSIGKVKK